MWKKVVVDVYEVLSLHLSGTTEYDSWSSKYQTGATTTFGKSHHTQGEISVEFR
jgi:hypothetical protein